MRIAFTTWTDRNGRTTESIVTRREARTWTLYARGWFLHPARKRSARNIIRMIRTGLTALIVLTAVILAVAVVWLSQEQKRQARELSRLAECVSTLERNQGTPQGQPVRGCPIYN